MNRRTPSWIAIAAGVLFAAAASAQDSPAPAGASSYDCPPTASSTSGKASHHAAARHAKAKTNMSGSGTAAAVGSGYPVLRTSFAQCTSKKNRSERAECVRTAYENRYGNPDTARMSGSGTALASASPRKPCL